VHKPWSASSPESEKLIQKFAEAEANIPDTYEILGMLGEGGMATVFQVKDKRTKQIYALKVLAPQLVQDDASTKRFEQEAHATERLINPSIARVHESGMGKLGAPYLVMDFVPGENLAELLKIRTRLSPRHALRLFIQIADAIFYAHSMGVVHRDIKPSNIIVHYDETRVKGKRASACLVDFGIAKMRLDNQATHGLTRTGEIFGSPQYMSPEQCEGAELDVRSDIYSFGCVMYETITGKPPFQSENPIELILKHLQEEPEPITEVGVGANAEELNYVTMRCLQKDPKERYQTMIEVEAALKDCLLRGHVARTVSLDHSHSSPGKSKTGRVDQSDNHQEEEICSVCGKPIAGLAQSNVTRYLSWESRCQCNTSDDEFLGDKTQFLDPAEVSDPVTKEQLSVAAANLPDQYEVLELIGQGGMGAVFKVRDKRLDKTFAVKMLRPQMANNAEAQARFQTEARAVSALTHVNLAAVFDYGVGKHGAPYLVMEYLDGDTLGKIIRTEDCIAVPRAVDLFIQVGEAISHAHEKGVIHRDLKPSNIIVEHSDSGTEIAKLVDFGIAKTMAAGASRNTQTGDVLGSPPYMSPEQCLGKKLDARSDIYAFGCVMYEALCGRPPFSGRNQIQIIVRHVKDAPAELSASCTVQPIPDDLNYIVMRCLSKEPGNRYQRMTELLHDLQNFRDNKPITHVPIAKELSKASIGATFLKLLWPFGH
jgi:serine/threonine protein kinase